MRESACVGSLFSVVTLATVPNHKPNRMTISRSTLILASASLLAFDLFATAAHKHEALSLVFAALASASFAILWQALSPLFPKD